MVNEKINYRPEIDGLRAIAVISVILYHAKITLFSQSFLDGGFLGVDIFFVISGYLISSIILKEKINTGIFSFSNFYQRRARRILPALFFVMILSYPMAWFYLLPDSFIDFSRSILSSLIFSSNFYFWVEAQEYAATSSLLKPFLHTWSLSVEEQFYIVFPIFLLLIYRFFKKYILLIFVLFFLISITFAQFGSVINPSLNFYMLPSRMWELLAGSILAFLELKFGRNNKRIHSQIFNSIGIFLIFYSFIFFNDQMNLPSIKSLVPVLGTMLLIWFSQKNELVTKILSTKYFMGVGLISYSLYLFHFPIMAFGRVNNPTPSELDKLIWVLLTIILSIISYFIIEKPFRNKNILSNKILVASLTVIFILITFFNFYTIRSKGFSENLAWVLHKEFGNIEPKFKLKNEKGQSCHNIIEIENSCNFNKKSNSKIFLVGDSHFASFMYELKEKVVKKNFQFNARTSAGCIYLPNFTRRYVSTKQLTDKCNLKYLNDLRVELLSHPNSTVIIGGRLPLYTSGEYFNNQEGGIERENVKYVYSHIEKLYDWRDGFKLSILELLNNGNKVILVYPIPEVGINVAYALFKNMPVRYIKDPKVYLKKNRITTSFDVYKARSKESFDILNEIKNNNVQRIFPHKLFCNISKKNRCITHDERDVFYYDDDHLSTKGAEMITDLIMKKLN